MRTTKVIHVVSCHAEGEVGDVIVGGVAPPAGDTVWEQSRFIARDETLRNFVLNEPRGGVFRHVNLLVPAKDPKAQMGWIIMEPSDTPPMSGSNAICVATVLLDTGIVPMQEPETRMVLEAPGGLVEVTATCRDGKARPHRRDASIPGNDGGIPERRPVRRDVDRRMLDRDHAASNTLRRMLDAERVERQQIGGDAHQGEQYKQACSQNPYIAHRLRLCNGSLVRNLSEPSPLRHATSL